MSLSGHIDNKRKDFVTLVEGWIQGSDDSTLIIETKYPINFTQSRKKVCIRYIL